MQVLISGDDQAIAIRIREAFSRHGCPCPLSRMVPLDRLHDELRSVGGELDLVVLMLPSDEQSLAILDKARKTALKKLVVVGDARDPARILATIHKGADDYLDEAGDLNRQVGEFLGRIRTTGRSMDPHGRMTIVATASGGCGGSVVAVNLAVALAQEGRSCALLDFVPRQGDLAALLDLKPRHTLADLCRNIDKLDRKMFEQSLAAHERGVRVLAAPRRPAEIEHVTIEKASRVARLAQTCFADTVIDADDVFQQSGSQLLEWATRIVLLMRLDFTSLRNAGRLLDHWRQMQLPPEKLMLVANRSGQLRELPLAQAEDALQQRIAFSIPDDPKTMNSCINRGCPAVSERPRTRLAAVFRDMARAIAGASAPDAATSRIPTRSGSLLEHLGLGWMRSLAPRSDKILDGPFSQSAIPS
ncbi:MAG: hypothetical protein WD069_09790 [Planctomycetales bacterium]